MCVLFAQRKEKKNQESNENTSDNKNIRSYVRLRRLK